MPRILRPCIFNFTLQASSFENTMSKFSLFLCFDKGTVWTLSTCLCWDFLRDSNDPPMVGPPLIIFISPMVLLGRSCGHSSSLGFSSNFARVSCLCCLNVSFFTNFYSFPFRINSSICSFKSLQSSM